MGSTFSNFKQFFNNLFISCLSSCCYKNDNHIDNHTENITYVIKKGHCHKHLKEIRDYQSTKIENVK